MSDTITFEFPRRSSLPPGNYETIRDLEPCDRCGTHNDHRAMHCGTCEWPRYLQRVCWGRHADLVYVPKPGDLHGSRSSLPTPRK